MDALAGPGIYYLRVTGPGIELARQAVRLEGSVARRETVTRPVRVERWRALAAWGDSPVNGTSAEQWTHQPRDSHRRHRSPCDGELGGNSLLRAATSSRRSARSRAATSGPPRSPPFKWRSGGSKRVPCRSSLSRAFIE